MSYLDVPFPTTYYKRRSIPLGNHIIANYTQRNIVLYLTCPRSVGVIAAAYQNFRKYDNHLRIYWWLTPTFMAAVHESNWGLDSCILAITITRRGFEELLSLAAESKYAMRPEIRFSWEVERDPFGYRTPRRSFMMKLRSGSSLVESFLDEFVLQIDDVTSYARRQRSIIQRQDSVRNLMVPHERVYEPISYYVSRDLEIDKGYPMDDY